MAVVPQRLSDGFVQAYIFIVSSIIGAVAWAFRLEGRVSKVEELHQQSNEDLKILLTTQFAAMDHRLDRIEDRLDDR